MTNASAAGTRGAFLNSEISNLPGITPVRSFTQTNQPASTNLSTMAQSILVGGHSLPDTEKK